MDQEHDDFKDHDHDSTPKAMHDHWRLTPSLLDPDSFAFASFANQPPGYYTPTPGGTNTMYHSQAGDLHTPTMGIGVCTPLSLPTSDASVPIGSSMDLPTFAAQTLQPHQFHHFDPFAQSSFAPSQFQHQPSFEQMDASDDLSPMKDIGMDTEMHLQSPLMGISSKYDGPMAAPPLPSTEMFRYHVTLNAPTAMIKQADEVPITYLNKGQAYSMSIADTAPPSSITGQVNYRTHVRVSFEDEQQRQRPASCWQLWKEGRGTNEAHQRGGKLQAVEFVDPTTSAEGETEQSRVQLESASFDGFAFTWSSGTEGSTDCSVAVRFNFLSTDFSHSKGVKGIPVRLCAKTQIISSSAPESSLDQSEVCFSKVKLFRDHGAERKLSNDIAHVKKTIDKLKQQIAQAEAGVKEFGKRKRSGSTAMNAAASSRPGKVPKHKRTWSMSSASSSNGRVSAEEDLHHKLATMQDMFTSTRPVSVLYLRGDELDDPDLHPVQLTGETQAIGPVVSSNDMWDTAASAKVSQHTATSSLVSPTSSSSGHEGNMARTFRSPTHAHNDWNLFQTVPPTDLQASNPQQLASPPDQPVKVRKAHHEKVGMLSGWIEALGVDASYRPPPEAPIKPLACIYILAKENSTFSEREIYRAVYLMQRTAKDLINGIASKLDIEPTRVLRTIHVNRKGLKIDVDDDVVQHLPEGQDMVITLVPIKSDPVSLKREWDCGPTDIQVDGDVITSHDVKSNGFEMELTF
ncbi:MAG: hypothetical protein M1833_004702 [Piccolia ochrophora]|nr:MAG: hypothetical protein M1833_004702 [Piccolia ochrophora]